MIFEKQRWEVWNLTQHPYKHTLAEFAYVNPALPGVTNAELALNYMVNVMYPNTQPNVPTPGDLPAAGNTIGDFRVVDDDGDGRSAGYRWDMREGDLVAKWYKILDVDWSTDAILAAVTDVTDTLYVYKPGVSDLDSNGDPIVGLYAGQRITGGNLSGQNLTLHPNSGDGVGPQTGYVQTDGHFRPTLDDTYDLGTATERFVEGFFSNSILVDTMTIATGSITDTTGTIDFADENLTTTGNITGGVVTGTSLVADDTTNSVTLVPGLITDTSGAISFGAANLSTTGTLGAGVTTLTEGLETLIFDPDNGASRSSIVSSLGAIDFNDEDLYTTGALNVGSITTGLLDVDNLRLDGNTISSTDTDGNIIIVPDGTGIVDIQKAMTTLGITATGIVGVTGELSVDNLHLDGNTISSTDTDGNITMSPDGTGIVETTASIFPDVTAAPAVGGSTYAIQQLNFNFVQSFPTTRNLAQVFTTDASLNQSLNSITVQPSALSPTNQGVLSLYIHEASGAGPGVIVPNGTSTNSINILGTATNTNFTFTFSGVTLNPSTQYAMVILGSDVVSGQGAIGIALSGTNPYAGGSEWYDDGGGWIEVPGDDWYFDVDISYGAVLPATGYDLGDSSLLFRDLYLVGGIKDATDEIAIGTLLSFRSGVWRDLAQTLPAQAGDALFYDAVNGVWLASTPDSEVDHTTIANITVGDSGHTQFAMLAGRAGGQLIQGGTAALENLTLESTSHATKGLIFARDAVAPETDASFSGGWSGTDLGDGLYHWRDVYTKGEFFGMRLENVTTGTLPSASGQNIGRVVYATDNNKAYVDTGTLFKVLGVSKYISDTTWNGVETVKNIDVSASIEDARNAQWQILDNANNFEIMGVKIEMTSATNVRITANVPLAAGSYRLIGIE